MSLMDFITGRKRPQKRLKRQLAKQKGRIHLYISRQVHFIVCVYAKQHDLSLRRAANQLIRIGFGYQTGALSRHENLGDEDEP